MGNNNMVTAQQLIADFPKHIEQYKQKMFADFYERMIKEFCRHGNENYGQPYQTYYTSRIPEGYSNKEMVYIGEELKKLGYFVSYEYDNNDPLCIEALEIKLTKYQHIAI